MEAGLGGEEDDADNVSHAENDPAGYEESGALHAA